MRSIITALFILILSPFVASAQCVSVNTTKAQYVKVGAPGYIPVAVYLHVDVPDEDAAAVAQKAFFGFWIAGSYPNIHADRSGPSGQIIQEVDTCTIMNAKKTFVKVRAYVDDKATKDHSYVLYTAIPLPKRLVAGRPVVTTTLDSGLSYRGEWGTAVINKRHAATLTLRAVE